MKDPKKNELVFNPAGIKSVSVKYCQDLLTNREPALEFKRNLLWKERVHAVRMTESFEDDPKFTLDRFNQTFDVLSKTKKEKYKFILTAGQSYFGALFKLYQVVWETKIIPEGWKESILLQLDKGKKDKLNLDNKRHIHTKDPTQKYFSHMVTTATKPLMVENVTPFQIGAIPGHKAEEHLFTIKSVIALIEKEEDAIAIQQYDLAKFFDKESILDVLSELYKCKIRGKLYKLLYSLNKTTKIKVRTAVGDSELKEINKTLG